MQLLIPQNWKPSAPAPARVRSRCMPTVPVLARRDSFPPSMRPMRSLVPSRPDEAQS